jgi:hypothetical protein
MDPRDWDNLNKIFTKSSRIKVKKDDTLDEKELDELMCLDVEERRMELLADYDEEILNEERKEEEKRERGRDCPKK